MTVTATEPLGFAPFQTVKRDVKQRKQRVKTFAVCA